MAPRRGVPSPGVDVGLNRRLRRWLARELLGVSYAQVAASNGIRPAAVLVGVVAHLLARLRRAGIDRASGDPLLWSLVIQDATVPRLSLRLAQWLPPLQHPTVSGVRVQIWLHPAQDLPEVVDLTSVKLNDHLSWDCSVLGDPACLSALAGQTIVSDLGSSRHTTFRDRLAAGVHG